MANSTIMQTLLTCKVDVNHHRSVGLPFTTSLPMINRYTSHCRVLNVVLKSVLGFDKITHLLIRFSLVSKDLILTILFRVIFHLLGFSSKTI